jgi:hypothetical protein
MLLRNLKNRKFIFDNKFIIFDKYLINFYYINSIRKKFCEKILLNEIEKEKEKERKINYNDNDNDNNLIIKEEEKSQLEILEKKANRKFNKLKYIYDLIRLDYIRL